MNTHHRDEASSARANGIASPTALAMTLPADNGCYVLILQLACARSITVGRFGKALFSQGTYLYVGSAFGSGGLRSRVGRHLCGAGTPRWHIDYLRAVADVHDCFYTVTDKPRECEWSQALAALSNATIPVPHFGSSDCRSGCRSHLIAFSADIRLILIQRVLADVAGEAIVQVFIDCRTPILSVSPLGRRSVLL
jgi:Uri superfamily endonuclease